MLLLLLVFFLLLLCIAGLAIKLLLKKNGQFKRSCASRDPYTGESSGCQCPKSHLCSAPKPPYQPLDVTQDLLDETR